MGDVGGLRGVHEVIMSPRHSSVLNHNREELELTKGEKNPEGNRVYKLFEAHLAKAENLWHQADNGIQKATAKADRGWFWSLGIVRRVFGGRNKVIHFLASKSFVLREALSVLMRGFYEQEVQFWVKLSQEVNIEVPKLAELNNSLAGASLRDIKIALKAVEIEVREVVEKRHHKITSFLQVSRGLLEGTGLELRENILKEHEELDRKLVELGRKAEFNQQEQKGVQQLIRELALDSVFTEGKAIAPSALKAFYGMETTVEEFFESLKKCRAELKELNDAAGFSNPVLDKKSYCFDLDGARKQGYLLLDKYRSYYAHVARESILLKSKQESVKHPEWIQRGDWSDFVKLDRFNRVIKAQEMLALAPSLNIEIGDLGSLLGKELLADADFEKKFAPIALMVNEIERAIVKLKEPVEEFRDKVSVLRSKLPTFTRVYVLDDILHKSGKALEDQQLLAGLNLQMMQVRFNKYVAGIAREAIGRGRLALDVLGENNKITALLRITPQEFQRVRLYNLNIGYLIQLRDGIADLDEERLRGICSLCDKEFQAEPSKEFLNSLIITSRGDLSNLKKVYERHIVELFAAVKKSGVTEEQLRDASQVRKLKKNAGAAVQDIVHLKKMIPRHRDALDRLSRDIEGGVKGLTTPEGKGVLRQLLEDVQVYKQDVASLLQEKSQQYAVNIRGLLRVVEGDKELNTSLRGLLERLSVEITTKKAAFLVEFAGQMSKVQIEYRNLREAKTTQVMGLAQGLLEKLHRLQQFAGELRATDIAVESARLRVQLEGEIASLSLETLETAGGNIASITSGFNDTYALLFKKIELQAQKERVAIEAVGLKIDLEISSRKIRTSRANVVRVAGELITAMKAKAKGIKPILVSLQAEKAALEKTHSKFIKPTISTAGVARRGQSWLRKAGRLTGFMEALTPAEQAELDIKRPQADDILFFVDRLFAGQIGEIRIAAIRAFAKGDYAVLADAERQLKEAVSPFFESFRIILNPLKVYGQEGAVDALLATITEGGISALEGKSFSEIHAEMQKVFNKVYEIQQEIARAKIIEKARAALVYLDAPTQEMLQTEIADLAKADLRDIAKLNQRIGDVINRYYQTMEKHFKILENI
jgi:hypothetical protein